MMFDTVKGGTIANPDNIGRYAGISINVGGAHTTQYAKVFKISTLKEGTPNRWAPEL